eukprot:1193991-Prorocentrum_minimum.AAC.1
MGPSSSSSSRSFRFSISSFVTPARMRRITCAPLHIGSPPGKGIWSGFSCTTTGSWSEVCAIPLTTRDARRIAAFASPTSPLDSSTSSTLLLPLCLPALPPEIACGVKDSPRSLLGNHMSVGPTPSLSAHRLYSVSLAVRPPHGRSVRNHPPLKSPPTNMGTVPLGHTSPIHSATPGMIMACLHSPGGRYTFSSSMCPRLVSTRSASA